MRILLLGATGMLGNTFLRVFLQKNQHEVWGTIRSDAARRYFSAKTQAHLISGVDVLNPDTLAETVDRIAPDVVVNCVGLVKQRPDANNPLAALPLNAMLPHRLSRLCRLIRARLIHLSTDCVYSGRKGMYLESDLPDAEDLYGKSKAIGEICDMSHVVTLRTSTIGHEVSSGHGLIEWFLAQEGVVKGYSNAIFSGLATAELAMLIHDVVLPAASLNGLYNVSTKPIAKMDLLRMVADRYGKTIEIKPDPGLCVDRSLDSTRLRSATGYVAPGWKELVDIMFESQSIE